MNAATSTLTSSTVKTPIWYPPIAAYFLLLAIPSGLDILLNWIGVIVGVVGLINPALHRGSFTWFDESFTLLFALITTISFLYLLPGYWKLFRGGTVSPAFWRTSLFYSLLYLAIILCPNLPIQFGGTLLSVPISLPLPSHGPIEIPSGFYHFRIPDLSPYTSFSVPVDISALILVGAILSYGCYRNTKPYAPSPN